MENSTFDNGSLIGNTFVVQISDSLSDENLSKLCENTIIKAHSKNVKGVLYSFTNVDLIDTITIQKFIDSSKTITLLGVQVVWTGLKPGLISSILDFDIHLDSITTCLNLNEGLEYLKGL